jgi:hypothetical protein
MMRVFEEVSRVEKSKRSSSMLYISLVVEAVCLFCLFVAEAVI